MDSCPGPGCLHPRFWPQVVDGVARTFPTTIKAGILALVEVAKGGQMPREVRYHDAHVGPHRVLAWRGPEDEANRRFASRSSIASFVGVFGC